MEKTKLSDKQQMVLNALTLFNKINLDLDIQAILLAKYMGYGYFGSTQPLDRSYTK